jgi:hypothetical protein
MFPLPFMSKKPAEEPKKVYIPVDLVLSYAAQGFSEADIFSRLQSQGFEPEHIDRALKIALKERVNAAPGVELRQPQATLPQPTDFYGPAPEPMVSRRPAAPLGYPPERVIQDQEQRPMTLEDVGRSNSSNAYTFEQKSQPQQQERSPIEEITIEELIEGIISERWKEFEERLSDFEKRDMQLQSQIEDLRKRLKEIEATIGEKDKGLSGKLEEFGGSVENIEGRIGSIERVFREVLPDLTQNIKTMTDFVEKVKEEEKEIKGH